MNSNKYPVANYVPYNPIKESYSIKFGHDLDYTLKKHAYERIISDPKYHFQNCYVINFDIIHHECRGDEQLHTRKFYNTIFNKKINEEITGNHLKNFLFQKQYSVKETMYFSKKRF